MLRLVFAGPTAPCRSTLALMHGPAFSGDGAAALRSLGDDYDRRARERLRGIEAELAL